LSYFNGSSISVEKFSKNTQIAHLLKYRQVEAEFWNRTDRRRDRQTDRRRDRQAEGQTDRGTDMTKRIFVFCYFANAPAKGLKFLSFYCLDESEAELWTHSGQNYKIVYKIKPF
jgi:hypothetical protein